MTVQEVNWPWVEIYFCQTAIINIIPGGPYHWKPKTQSGSLEFRFFFGFFSKNAWIHQPKSNLSQKVKGKIVTWKNKQTKKNLNYSTLKKHFQELPGSTLHYHQWFVVSLKSEEEFFSFTPSKCWSGLVYLSMPERHHGQFASPLKPTVNTPDSGGLCANIFSHGLHPHVLTRTSSLKRWCLF